MKNLNYYAEDFSGQTYIHHRIKGHLFYLNNQYTQEQIDEIVEIFDKAYKKGYEAGKINIKYKIRKLLGMNE